VEAVIPKIGFKDPRKARINVLIFAQPLCFRTHKM
jgi:hypothetical protein